MRHKRQIIVITLPVIVLAGLLILAWRWHSRLYTVTVLPRVGTRVVEPHAINDRGQVVGLCQGRFLLWERDVGWRDLGTATVGLDINNAGQIAGTMTDPNSKKDEAFLWDPKVGLRMLGTLGGGYSHALGLNNRGQVVGYSGPAGYRHPFIWDSKTGMRELETPDRRDGGAQTVSDTNEVFGYYRGPVGANADFVCYWNLRDGTATPAQPLPSGAYYDMNGRGHVVGSYPVGDRLCIVLWHEKARVTKLFSCGPVHDRFTFHHFRINDANQVAYSMTLRSGPARDRLERFVRWLSPPRVMSYLWDPKRGKVSLHRYMPRGMWEFAVRDLNDRGCILGIAHSKNGSSETVLLEPIPKRWGK